jgi:hypothetical protein
MTSRTSPSGSAYGLRTGWTPATGVPPTIDVTRRVLGVDTG